jgi:hypothetical protein
MVTLKSALKSRHLSPVFARTPEVWAIKLLPKLSLANGRAVLPFAAILGGRTED